MHIESVDLNLIPPLIALLEERHVSHAAARSGLTQPAMSRVLQRLRQAFDDPLLIRDAGEYRLTQHAQNIYSQLTSIVPQLEMLLSPSRFDPRSSTRAVNLAGTDNAAYTFAPAVCRQILADAPLTPVRFHAWRYQRVAEQILRGNVDLGLYGGYLADELSSEELFVEQFVCVVADTHPLATVSALTLADYCRFSHVVVDVENGIQPDIDYALDKLNSPRKPAITVPYHTVVPALLHGTELIATLPQRFVSAWPETAALQLLPAPAQISTMPYRMVWHPALENDQWHQWLRNIVRSTVNKTSS